jgi:hypothetical protein
LADCHYIEHPRKILISRNKLVNSYQNLGQRNPPESANYGGDGKADVAIFRDGTWWIRQSANGISIQQFGLANDKPAQSAYLP